MCIRRKWRCASTSSTASPSPRVIGVPDTDFGQRVVAVVVSRGGALKTMLAGYKVLKQIENIAELPRNAMGKVQNKRLRELYAES